MKISRNNKIPDYDSITVTGDDSGQTIANTTSGDFSTAWSSAGTDASFSIQYNFSSSFQIGYVAIAGSNVFSTAGTVSVFVDGNLKDSVTCSANHLDSVLMITFDEITCSSSVKLLFNKTTASNIITITFVAAGQQFTLGDQNQEQAGYLRNWMTRSQKVRTQVNESAAPVAYVNQRIARQGTLLLNNIKRTNLGTSPANTNTEIGDFLKHVYEDGAFFIKEFDGSILANQDESSYLCFDAQFLPPAAHPATRQLNNLKLTFKTFTGY